MLAVDTVAICTFWGYIGEHPVPIRTGFYPARPHILAPVERRMMEESAHQTPFFPCFSDVGGLVSAGAGAVVFRPGRHPPGATAHGSVNSTGWPCHPAPWADIYHWFWSFWASSERLGKNPAHLKYRARTELAYFTRTGKIFTVDSATYARSYARRRP